jgi:hypothetical protein
VTAATLGAWVGDGRQVGQQMTGLGHLQRDGIGAIPHYVTNQST